MIFRFCQRKHKDTAFFMPMLRSRGIYRLEIQGLYRHEQSPPAKQGTDLKGKGLAFSNAFTSGKLGLCPFSLFYHRKINAQFSSIFFIRSCSFLATCILRLLANIIISLLTRRQRGTIASIIPNKLNPNKINER